MSKAHAKQFHSKVNKDAALRRKIREAGRQAVDKIIGLGKEHGLTFTHAELSDIVGEAWKSGKHDDHEDGPHTCMFVSERPEY